MKNKTKKIVCFLALLGVITTILSAGTYSGGEGTENDPYLISNEYDLYELSLTSVDWDKFFVQTASVYYWHEVHNSIGVDSYNSFQGNYNGQGYYIFDLYVENSNSDYQGLFGYIENAVISNVYNYDCTVTGCFRVGGLVGYSLSSTITNCYSTGNVSATSNYAGGLVGYSVSSTITNCYSTGNVSATSNYGGGLVGYSASSTITNCYSTGNVSATSDYYWNYWAGGLVGYSNYSSSVTNCYSTGNVSGDFCIGGLVGGNCYFSTIENSYSTGNVSGDFDIGGLVGYNDTDATVTNSFWNTESSGQVISAGGVGKTTAEMQSLGTFFDAGWDFIDEDINGTNDYWGINPTSNNGYPFLEWQGFTHVLPTYSGGNGTEENPYQISYLLDLFLLSSNINDWSSYFIQTDDIDARISQNWNSGDGFSPIGNSMNKFSGSYNGQGFAIDGLSIDRPTTDFQGLFGITDNADISNLGLTNVDISGHNSVGGLVGRNYNSTVTNSYNTGSISGEWYVGCLVGYNKLSIVTNSYSSGNVNGYSQVGGLVGRNDNTSTVNNSYSTGSVSGNDVAGSGTIGGLVGYNYDNSIVNNSYNAGSVSGNSIVGSLVGYNDNSTVTNSFWDTETSGQATSYGGTGKTTEEMQSIVTYFNAGWDLLDESTNGNNDFWGINSGENSGYPFLAWQGYQNIKYSGGEGTINSPYLISELKDLLQLSTFTEDWDKYFIQTAEIDASDTQSWNSGAGFSPIGNETTNFAGEYDGQQFTIDNVYINWPSENDIGLFGIIYESKINRLFLTNTNVTGNGRVGGLVGKADSNSIVKNSFVSGSISGNYAVGGLIGNCNNSSSIKRCYSVGSITGNTSTGGLVGASYSSSDISDCYSKSDVSGDENSGGFIGRISSNVVIDYSYCTGVVLGTTAVGGFVGLNSGIDNISNSFWDTETSGLSASAGGIGKSTAEMNSYTTFFSDGWDFMEETANGTDDFWGINPEENSGYPFLQWQGYIYAPPPYSSGSGTEESPYLISNLEDLLQLSSNVPHWHSNKFFLQIAEINASDTQNWNNGQGFSPIGSFTDKFNGVYDGGGYSIQDLYINRPNEHFMGFFGCTSGSEIKNVKLVNVNITGNNSNGGLVGCNDEGSTVINCSSSGAVFGEWQVGGLVGFNDDNSVIYCCSSSGSVEGDYNIGGLVGSLRESGSINNSYSTASASGIARIGGFVGLHHDSSIINKCYSTGNVSGSDLVGGLIGFSVDSIVNNSFWNIETSGQSVSAGGTGKTTAELHDMTTYTDATWDFIEETTNGTEDIWGINSLENGGYPFLFWQGYEHVGDLNIPENVTIINDGSIIQISWDEVIGANFYKIFAADAPDGSFEEVTEQGTFAPNRTSQTWSAPIGSSKKFYYVVASTDESREQDKESR